MWRVRMRETSLGQDRPGFLASCRSRDGTGATHVTHLIDFFRGKESRPGVNCHSAYILNLREIDLLFHERSQAGLNSEFREREREREREE